MAYVIAEPCVDVKDRACVDECPVDCIYEGQRTLYIDPNECVDGGAQAFGIIDHDDPRIAELPADVNAEYLNSHSQ